MFVTGSTMLELFCFGRGDVLGRLMGSTMVDFSNAQSAITSCENSCGAICAALHVNVLACPKELADTGAAVQSSSATGGEACAFNFMIELSKVSGMDTNDAFVSLKNSDFDVELLSAAVLKKPYSRRHFDCGTSCVAYVDSMSR